MLCQICNNEYESKNSLQKYCSSKCKKKANNKIAILKRTNLRNEAWNEKEKEKICPVCGKTFELDWQHRTQVYCGKQCRKLEERLSGSKERSDYKYGDKRRFDGNKHKALERDNYECQICGNKHNLIIHHKDKSGQSDNINNDLDNLVTLCRRCHINVHRNIL